MKRKYKRKCHLSTRKKKLLLNYSSKVMLHYFVDIYRFVIFNFKLYLFIHEIYLNWKRIPIFLS